MLQLPRRYTSPSNPTPKGANQNRFEVGDSCDLLYWDPVAGKCLCQDKSCAFTDLSSVNGTGTGISSSSGNGGSSGNSGSDGANGNSTGSNQASNAWKVESESTVAIGVIGVIVSLICGTLV